MIKRTYNYIISIMNPTSEMAIRRKLQKHCEVRGNAQALALKMHVDPATICRWRKGKKIPAAMLAWLNQNLEK